MQTAPSINADSPGPLRPSLVVSIHDVSTITRERVSLMLEDLAGVGVGVTSLLVIPDHHHRGGIDADATFGDWIRSQVRLGHEAVLHGFFHLRPASGSEGIVTRLITRSYTAGEGEFFDLGTENAAVLLRQGKEAMAACSLSPDGFIAPAWLLGADAERAVVAEGFSYTTRIGSVIDCAKGRSHPSRSMVYSVRAPWRRFASLVWNEGLFRLMRRAPLLRIGLHPPDWDHPAIRRHALARIAEAARHRDVTTYRNWLDLWRSSVHERCHH
jgi:hypothetical protein